MTVGVNTIQLAGCAPVVLGANQVGDEKDATWVYVRTDDKDEAGVYRCTDRNGAVVCKKAKME